MFTAALRWIVLSTLAIAAAGCAARPSVSTGTLSDGTMEPGPADFDLAAAVPPGLQPVLVNVREGKALERARRPLEQIVAPLPAPLFWVEDAVEDAAGEGPSTEAPSLVVQHRYLAARRAWRRGLRYEAINLLEQARRLAPDSPQILRFLGRIQEEQNNTDRSFPLFMEAVRLDPRDPYTLLMIGRHLAEQGKTDEAIAVLARLASLKTEARAAKILEPLTRLYLGDTLRNGGYDHAATVQWQRLLESQIRFDRFEGDLRDQIVDMQRRRALLWLHVGDAHHRLGRPDRALAAYAEATGAKSVPALASRLVLTHLRLRRLDAAKSVVIALMAEGDHPKASQLLLEDLLQRGVDPGVLVADIRPLYERQNRSTVLLLAMWRMMDRADGLALLHDHMEARPADRAVFDLLVRALAERVEDRPEAVRAAVSAIGKMPNAGQVYSSILMRSVGSASDLLAAIASLEDAERQDPIVSYLAGRAHWAVGDWLEAIEHLQAAVRGAPKVTPARLELVARLLDAYRFEEAEVALRPLEEAADDRATIWRIRILTETGERDAAQRLLRDALRRDPNNIQLVLFKVDQDRHEGRAQAAEFALLDLMAARPSEPRVYEALVDLFFGMPSNSERWGESYRDMFRSLQAHIPRSAVARRERARTLLAREDGNAEAEKILRALLEENPQDHRALSLLVTTLLARGNGDEAEQLIVKRIDAGPAREPVLEIVGQFYTDLARVLLVKGDDEGVVAAVDRALAIGIPEPRFLLRIQRRALSRQSGRQAEQIEQRVRRAVEQYSKFEPDLLNDWAMDLEHAGDSERAEQIMLEILAKYPDHPDTNNSLGYTWADRDEHLEEAQRMIQIAVDRHPKNPAFLDSLGWVFYKHGQFEEAVRHLSRALTLPYGQDPVILDHLGDALYRLNRHEEAVKHWRDALAVFGEGAGTVESERLPGSLQRKIEAASKRLPVPVAVSPGAEKAAEGEAPAEPVDEALPAEEADGVNH